MDTLAALLANTDGHMMRDAGAFERWNALHQERLRRGPEGDHRQIGPQEHGLAMEYATRQAPVLSPLVNLLAIPGYTAYKKAAELTGLASPWSPASLGEMAEAYRGMGRGISNNIGDFLLKNELGMEYARTGQVPPTGIGGVPHQVRGPSMSRNLSEDEIQAMVLRSPEPPAVVRTRTPPPYRGPAFGL